MFLAAVPGSVRYAERNALRAGLCDRAQDWPWCSLAHRLADNDDPIKKRLSAGPVPLPADWTARVNRAQTKSELEALRLSVSRGQPFGDAQLRTAKTLGLESTFRSRGRPRKAAEPDE
jgi:putative transposase